VSWTAVREGISLVNFCAGFSVQLVFVSQVFVSA
jgi:hypothetical protein